MRLPSSGTADDRQSSQWVSKASRDAIRHFMWGIGDNNPRGLDPGSAAAVRHGGIVAPGCFLYAVDNTIPHGSNGSLLSCRWTWFEPIRCDDDIRAEPGPGPDPGKTRTTFRVGSRLVAQVDTDVHAGSGAPPQAEPYRYSPEELRSIEEAVLAEEPDWSAERQWRDVSVGQSVGTLTKGPLSIIDTIAWLSATQPAASGGPEDSAWSLGGYRDPGPQRTSWAGQLLENWMGRDGFLHRLAVEPVAPIDIGDTVVWSGTVDSVRAEADLGLVGVELVAVDQEATVVSRGSAVVVLPIEPGGRISFPLARVDP
ncbi:MAG: MaoC family dehydratase N-terminal domain-containing protein [Nocardioidaceae bacterium]